MSYILDALRKADAERERDPARGIHAQPAAGIPLRTAPRRPLWLWPAACALVAAVAAYGFWSRAPEVVASSARPAPAAVPAALTMRVPPAPAIVTVATSVTPPPPTPVEHMAAKAVVAPRVAAAHAPAPAMPATPAAAPAALGPVAVAPAAAARATPVTNPPALATPSPAATATAAPAASAPAAGDRIFARTELPLDVQHALPKLAVSGAVYSDNAAQRMLIVGGDVKSEGQELAPGVVLEQIRPRSAVLRFRGYRYSVAY